MELPKTNNPVLAKVLTAYYGDIEYAVLQYYRGKWQFVDLEDPQQLIDLDKEHTVVAWWDIRDLRIVSSI